MAKEPKPPEELKFEFNKVPDDYLQPENNFVNKEQEEASEKERIKSRKQDRKERKRYAKVIFNFIKIWAYVVIFIIIAIGKGNLKFDSSVIITLISTTTANVLALFAIVANYLFYRNKK